jgi:ABC-type nickel/cobalt efflux system permease component RcnA
VVGNGWALLIALASAGLLGLRHATDPDHVAAVVTLTAGEGSRRGGAAVRLGLCWSLGHGLTLLAFGIPVLAFNARLPPPIESAAEVAIGVVLVFLAWRLLRRWRSGHFHLHEHQHPGGIRHTHVHAHASERGHGHAHRSSRTPLGAFAVGLVHGIGGSAGVSVLLLATLDSRATAVAALVVLAAGAGAAMAVLSSGFGLALAHGPLLRRSHAVIPALAGMCLAFGGWYAGAALYALSLA